ncbi:40S ribosomal protein S27 [Collichthys lucidus]|uniref:40S ribosomal protein S27 n=1 Tax=Collichthys lucidus TaxID=240159 RepID=A0A4U5V2U9_COLLU|nr:40S ribosomal protein S27 [Collichthys lucidus]
MPLAKDLLHPSPEEEKRRHKKKRLVQCPNSYFMDVKCPGCYKITTVFSHAQTVVLCVGCSTVLCQPTGGKARLTEVSYCNRKLSAAREQQISVKRDAEAKTNSKRKILFLIDVEIKGDKYDEIHVLCMQPEESVGGHHCHGANIVPVRFYGDSDNGISWTQ